MNKHKARLRRGLKAKALIKRQGKRPRLVVFRSALHIYAQIVSPGEKGDVVMVSASSNDTQLKDQMKGNKTERAELVGKSLALRAKTKEIIEVAFDRSGFKYHGRVAALAKGAREGGLNF
ncbi:MAG: 50S ribosomal protein L18 [Gammaproteobacteria bacterium]|nr:50S ribosomal protein L18 [Gammaproteobacteria bacterium]